LCRIIFLIAEALGRNSGRFNPGVILVNGHDRFAVHVLHDDLELVHEEEGLGTLLREGVEPLLQGNDLIGVSCGEVVLLGRVLSDILV